MQELAPLLLLDHIFNFVSDRVDRFDKGTGNPLLKYIDDYGTLYVMQSKAHHIYSDSWKTYMGTPGRTPVDKKSLFRADVAFTLTSDPTDLVKGIKSDTVLAEIGLCKESCFDAANVMGNLDGAWTFQLVYLASPNIFSLQACTGGNVVDKVELDLNVITFMKCGGMYKWFVDMPKNEMYIEPGHEFGKQYRLKIANIECLNKYCLYSVFGVFRDGVAVGLQST